MKTIYAGVDPSIGNTGVVVLNEKGDVLTIANTKYIQSLRKKIKYYSLLRLTEIAKIVGDVIDSFQASSVRICYENYSYDSTNKSYTIGELNGVLKIELVRRFGHLHLVEPTVLKKFATGSGSAGKEKMIAQACSESRLISDLTDIERTSDICDAFLLSKFCWYRYNPENVINFENCTSLLRERLTATARHG